MDILTTNRTKLLPRLRSISGISQQKLADGIEYSLSMVSSVEQGIRYGHTRFWRTVAHFFGLTLDRFDELAKDITHRDNDTLLRRKLNRMVKKSA